jgi:CRP-like cAMP-binding protein
MIHTLELVVREHPFFQGLDGRHVHLIAGCAKNVRFEEGQVVFREGDPADNFYLIREGQVAVETMIPHRGPTIVHTAGAGDMLGWSWLFEPYRWHFAARAQRPTRALAFDGKCLRGKCEEDHDLGYEFFQRFTRLAIERLEETRLQLLDLYAATA